MSEPTPINRSGYTPSLSEELWYPGLATLADAEPTSISRLAVEIAYVQSFNGRMYLLRIRRTADPAGRYCGSIERLTKGKDGNWHTPRTMPETVRYAATPWEAANAASMAAGWMSADQLARGRQHEAAMFAWAEREQARNVAERRHLKPVGDDA